MKTVPFIVGKANRSDIQDLSDDVVVLVLSLLHGQDIARCTRVCRCFAELIRSNLFLQYKIELAQNGMVDGESSTLPVCERLQRLREYAYRFCNGIFDHEDLASHPLYAHQLRDLPRRSVVFGQHLTSILYIPHGWSDMALSFFTPGSTQAGIQSSRYLLPITMTDRQGLDIRQWAIDGEQDLLVMAERADENMPEQFRRRPDEFHIHFYSLSGSKCGQMPHPAATFPSLHFFASAGGMHEDIQPIVKIPKLHIAGQYVFWVLALEHGEHCRVSVEMCNWRMGKVISRVDVGTESVDVVPLDYPYLLLLPVERKEHPCFTIYSFSPSEMPNRHICMLGLPSEDLRSDECIEQHTIATGDQPQYSRGHFHADLSQSMVFLRFIINGPEHARETHYLIPRTTFLAQIRHAESRETLRADDSPVQPPIPWAEWGQQGCLRLQHEVRPIYAMPFGSRFPLLMVDESDSRSAAVYVFDINPHVARHQRQVLATAREQDSLQPRESGVAVIVEDIEAALPGVVDPHCSRIPYILYRFQLPYGPDEWELRQPWGWVIMSTTGFTVKMPGASEYEKTEQTWTV